MKCKSGQRLGLIEIKEVDVSLEKKIALAEFNNEVADEKIKFAVEDTGYDVVGIESKN